MTQQEFFERVLGVLQSLEIPYMVSGSVGAMVHGEPRLTNDMDIVVVLAPHQVDPLLGAFRTSSFYVPPRDSVLTEIERRGQFNIIHIDSGSKVDLIVRKDTPFAHTEFERRYRVPFTARLDAQSATPEDIILAKLQSYQQGQSPKHLEDIAGMLRVVGDQLDRGYLAQWVDRLDLRREWQLAQERSRRPPS